MDECVLDVTLDELQASSLSSILPLDSPPGFQQLCKPFFWNFSLLSNITRRTTAATDGERQRTGHSCKARWDGVCPDTTQRQRYVCKLREIKRRKRKGRSLAEYNSFVHYRRCFIHFHAWNELHVGKTKWIWKSSSLTDVWWGPKRLFYCFDGFHDKINMTAIVFLLPKAVVT